MIVNINKDFKLDREGVHKTWPSNQEIFRNIVSMAVNLSHKDGLNSDKRRLYDKIMNKMDESIDSKKDDVDFNATEIVFLEESFNKAVVPVSEVKMFSIVEEEILKLTK